MEKLTSETKKLMDERFGHDCIIALATTDDGLPHVRNVDAYYEDGAFYVVTYALSNKMKHIAKNPTVAIAGDWFTAHGTGSNLGFVGKDENKELMDKLKAAFSSWINEHGNLADENTCILRIQLTDGILFSHGTRYDIDFTH